MNQLKALLVLALLLPAVVAAAGEPEPTATRSVFQRSRQGSLGIGLNPLGLQGGVDVSWRRGLSSSSSPLLRDAHLSFGVAPRLTPSYARLAAFVEVAPLSILELRAGIEPSAYFGTFRSLLYFGSYADRFDEEARSARAGEAAAGLAGRAFLAPTLKLGAGRFVLRSRSELEWWRARQKRPYFYEPGRDTLLRAAGDSLLASETLLLYELRGGSRRRLLGPVHDLTLVSGARA